MLEPDLAADGIHQMIDPRLTVVIGTGKAGQPESSPLDRHRGVAPGQRDDGLPGLGGQKASPVHGRPVKVELTTEGCHVSSLAI